MYGVSHREGCVWHTTGEEEEPCVCCLELPLVQGFIYLIFYYT
jgi:hypothetical protein